ncbi:hypothetical protein HYH03_018554 [Edaphochlamys debaryana]|uniref:Pherophorin domain-containing protein n=1 Tax=Edaphochlamys debaryana TaxID=47281 RepID=A0A835XLP2_9CHLO|nr:hypothetical protein HYH03_018554 [Edaphochlamys debaryana]|eukprot:KAG2482509.1 hypothetical protein HYH03_018554 [Edaphochlamys debaryana]
MMLRGERMAVAVVAVVLAFAASAQAGMLAGTKFPFEGCKQNLMNSPYYATLLSYNENTKAQTSKFCIQLHSKPADACIKNGFRCCNTHINKIKFFPALDCQGSLGSVDVLAAKKTVTSVYWEEHDGFEIVKVTPLMEWLTNPATIDGQVLCFNLRAPCWTMAMFAYDHEQLEYSLYDKKQDNYECCPTGIVDVMYTDVGDSKSAADALPVRSPPPPMNPPRMPPPPKKAGKAKSPKPSKPSKPVRTPKPVRSGKRG